MNKIIFGGILVSLCWMISGNAVANGDINIQVENHLNVPLRYQQSECLQARCPRSFPTAIERGASSAKMTAKSIRGNGGSIRLDYSSVMGTCRFIVQTARHRDGRCEAPVTRAFSISNSLIKCGFTTQDQDKNCNLKVGFSMSQSD